MAKVIINGPDGTYTGEVVQSSGGGSSGGGCVGTFLALLVLFLLAKEFGLFSEIAQFMRKSWQIIVGGAIVLAVATMISEAGTTPLKNGVSGCFHGLCTLLSVVIVFAIAGLLVVGSIWMFLKIFQQGVFRLFS